MHYHWSLKYIQFPIKSIAFLMKKTKPDRINNFTVRIAIKIQVCLTPNPIPFFPLQLTNWKLKEGDWDWERENKKIKKVRHKLKIWSYIITFLFHISQKYLWMSFWNHQKLLFLRANPKRPFIKYLVSKRWNLKVS